MWWRRNHLHNEQVSSQGGLSPCSGVVPHRLPSLSTPPGRIGVLCRPVLIYKAVGRLFLFLSPRFLLVFCLQTFPACDKGQTCSRISPNVQETPVSFLRMGNTVGAPLFCGLLRVINRFRTSPVDILPFPASKSNALASSLEAWLPFDSLPSRGR